jgi:hypothetical protein
MNQPTFQDLATQLSPESQAALHVEVAFVDDEEQHGCMFAPRGSISVAGGPALGRPCNRPECRRCDPLRDALFSAGMAALEGRVASQRRRLTVRERAPRRMWSRR